MISNDPDRPEVPETIRGSGGTLTTEGHVGGTVRMGARSMEIGGGAKL